jgi:hypothetical protein
MRQWLFVGLLVVLSALWGASYNPIDPDLWHRLALGEILIREKSFPVQDPFGYRSVAGPSYDHEWGSAVLFYLLYDRGGVGALIALKLGVLALTLAYVAKTGGVGDRPWSSGKFLFYALILFALLPSFLPVIRCMVFTHLFFACWLCWLEAWRKGAALSFGLFLVTAVLWANLHGGFVVGLVLMGFYGVLAALQGRWEGRLAALFLLCSAATLINPYGINLWKATAEALYIPRPTFPEWAPVNWADGSYPGYKVLVGLGLLLFLWKMRARWNVKTVDWLALAALGGGLAISLRHARHTSLFAILAGVFFPAIWRSLPGPPWAMPWNEGLKRLARSARALSSVALPFLVAVFLWPPDGVRVILPRESCPVGAVRYLQARDVRGRLLVPFNYGSYALWHLREHMRVSIDGRFDLVYTLESYEENRRFFQAEGSWREYLKGGRHDAILCPRNASVVPLLRVTDGWKEVYSDGQTVVFLPSSPIL